MIHLLALLSEKVKTVSSWSLSLILTGVIKIECQVFNVTEEQVRTLNTGLIVSIPTQLSCALTKTSVFYSIRNL